MLDLGVVGYWLTRPFSHDNGYTLNEAKGKCSAACIENLYCHYASLYHTEHDQTCTLNGLECGDWESTKNGSYHLYQKGT